MTQACHKLIALLCILLGVFIHGIDAFPKIKLSSETEPAASGNAVELLTTSGTSVASTEPKVERSVASDKTKKTETKDDKAKSSKPAGRSMGDRSHKCPGVTCSAPPPDATCEVSTSATINPLVPMLGSTSDCCPVHACTRKDGSPFTHYGLEGEGVQASSSSYSSGTGINNFPTPSPPADFGNFGSFPAFGNKQFGFPGFQNMQGFGGGFNNNRFNRNVPNAYQYQAAIPQWDIYRERRTPQQFFRPEFYAPQQQLQLQPGAFQRFV